MRVKAGGAAGDEVAAWRSTTFEISATYRQAERGKGLADKAARMENVFRTWAQRQLDPEDPSSALRRAFSFLKVYFM
jgi:hypothetical protein